MKNFYFTLALVALVLLGSSCRSRQVTHRNVNEATVVTGVRQQPTAQPTVIVRDAATQPQVAVSFRQAEAEVEAMAVVRQMPVAETTFRQENVSVFFAADAPVLLRYSVVVASLSTRWSAESLQTRLQSDGHHVIIAQNEQGMFRVIVGSFDDRASAVAQREALRRQYAAMGSPDFLRRTYGIPFNDLWILRSF